jgi:hypothetical protein
MTMRRVIIPGVLMLVCAIATTAHAQPPDQVVIDIQNAPPGGIAEIFVRGADADHTFVGASSGSIASSFMSDAKPSVDVAIDRCGDQVSVTVVGDGDLFPPEPENCDRRIVEDVPWAGGRRLAIDARSGTVVSVPVANASSPTAATAPSQSGLSTRESRGFSFTVSENYMRPSPFVHLVGRFFRRDDSLGTPAPNRTWHYSIGTGRSFGLSNSSGDDSVVVADPDWSDFVEVTGPSGISLLSAGSGANRTPVRTAGPGSTALVRLNSLVTRILPTFVRRGLQFSGPVRGGVQAASGRPTAGTLPGARIGSGQGQVSLASPTPSSNQNGSIARPPQLLLAARSFIDTLRQAFVPTTRFAAFSGSGVRLVVGPRGRREYWIEPMQSIAAAPQSATDTPRPSMKVFIRSLGRSTGENAQQAIFINDGNVPIRVIEGEAFATEPLEGVSEQALAKEMEKYAGQPRMTMNLTSYCLNFEKAAPTKGGVYRVAASSAQDQLEPVRRILEAAEQIRDAGQLHPDGDPNLYYHSVRQWTIWTVEKGFNERTFAEALLEYTKKNVVAAGRKWNKEFEAAARSIIPNRWLDVQRVLAESRR